MAVHFRSFLFGLLKDYTKYGRKVNKMKPQISY
jgi:hypothetical protein